MSWVSRVLTLCLLGTPAFAAGPPDAAPFEASGADWLAYAADIDDPKDGVEVLMIDVQATFDEAHRLTTTWRYVYRIDDPEEMTGWTAVSWSWAPWHQDKPELKARVLAPDGTEAWLDPSTLIEQNDAGDDPLMYSDLRTLRGPLPRVVPGAIVEEVAVIREHQPRIAGGNSWSYYPDRTDRVPRIARVQVQAPESVPLSITPVGIATPVRIKTRKGVQSWSATFTDRPAIPEWQQQLPLMDAPIARVEVSTWDSWAAVAQAYASRAASQIDPKGLEDLIAEVQAAPNRTEAIRRAVRGVQDRIRYTGVELGERSLIAYTPAESVARGFGDCKDQASAVVATLTAAGIPAHLALLRTGRGWEEDNREPGFTKFNHAIVHVPGDTPLWIDPTSTDDVVGQLPSGDQDRLALIIAPTTQGLVRTPTTSGSWTEHHVVDLRGPTWGSVQEVVTLTDTTGRSFRRNYSTSDRSQVEEWLTDYAEDAYRDATLASFTAPKDDRDARTWTLTMQVDGSGRATRLSDRADAEVFRGVSFDALPKPTHELTDAARETQGGDDLHYLLRPTRYEMTWEILLPPEFVPEALPPTTDTRVGSAHIWSSWTHEGDRIVGSVGSASAGGAFRLGDLDALGDAIDATEMTSNWLIRSAPRALADLHTDPVGAAAAAQRAMAADPGAAAPRAAYVRMLHALGFHAEAQKEARALFEAHPTDVDAAATVLDITSEPDNGLHITVLDPEVWLQAQLLLLHADFGVHNTTIFSRGVAWLIWDKRHPELVALIIETLDKELEEAEKGSDHEATMWLLRAEIGVLQGDPGYAAKHPPTNPTTAIRSLQVGAYALMGEGDKALRVVKTAPADTRAELVDQVRRDLISWREWEVALRLLPSLVPFSDDQQGYRAWVKILEGMRRTGLASLGRSPEDAAHGALDRVVLGPVRAPDGLDWFDQRHTADAKAWRRLLAAPADNSYAQQPYSFRDAALTAPVKLTSLDKQHQRAVISFFQAEATLWLARDKGSWRVLATSDWLVPLARLAHEAVQAGDEDAAKRWFDELKLGLREDADDGQSQVFRTIASKVLVGGITDARTQRGLAILAAFGADDVGPALAEALEHLDDSVVEDVVVAFMTKVPVVHKDAARQIVRRVEATAKDPAKAYFLMLMVASLSELPEEERNVIIEQYAALPYQPIPAGMLRAVSYIVNGRHEDLVDALGPLAAEDPTFATMCVPSLRALHRSEEALTAYGDVLAQSIGSDTKAGAFYTLLLADMGRIAEATNTYLATKAPVDADGRGPHKAASVYLAHHLGLHDISQARWRTLELAEQTLYGAPWDRPTSPGTANP